MRKGKTTLCITTGTVYTSAKQAADAHGIKYATMNALCDGRQNMHKGLAFCYMEDAPYKMEAIIRGVKVNHDAMLHKQLQRAQRDMDKARAKRDAANAEYEAAQAEYNEIAAKIGQ